MVHLPYEPRCHTSRRQAFGRSASVFPISEWMSEVSWKQNLVSVEWWRNGLRHTLTETRLRSHSGWNISKKRNKTLPSSEMWRHVVHCKFTDVSEESSCLHVQRVNKASNRLAASFVLLGLLFDHGHSTFVRNVCELAPDYIASYRSRQSRCKNLISNSVLVFHCFASNHVAHMCTCVSTHLSLVWSCPYA